MNYFASTFLSCFLLVVLVGCEHDFSEFDECYKKNQEKFSKDFAKYEIDIYKAMVGKDDISDEDLETIRNATSKETEAFATALAKQNESGCPHTQSRKTSEYEEGTECFQLDSKAISLRVELESVAMPLIMDAKIRWSATNACNSQGLYE